MRDPGLQGVIRGKPVKTTISDKAPDLLVQSDQPAVRLFPSNRQPPRRRRNGIACSAT
jgi:hypothetical protein